MTDIKYMRNLFKAIFRLFEAVNFSRKVKFSKEAKIGIFYSLSELQTFSFQQAMEEENFENEFNIEPIRNLQVFIFQSNRNELICSRKLIIIHTTSPFLLLMKTFINNNIKFDYTLINPVKTLRVYKDKYKLSFSNTIKLVILNFFSNLSLFSTISTLGKNPKSFTVNKRLRRYNVYLIHYAQNTLPVDLDINCLEHQIPEYLTDSNIDTHFVWSKEYADILRLKESETKFEIVGPILFQINRLSQPSLVKKKSIVIFDVTISKFKEHQNFYTEELGFYFLDDIIKTANSHFFNERYYLYLKPKRPYEDKFHSKKYIDKIFEYADKKVLTLYKPELDVFELLKDATLSISIPFTTAAVLSREMKVPSVFYYPFINNNLTNIYEQSIPLLIGKTQLKNYLSQNFG